MTIRKYQFVTFCEASRQLRQLLPECFMPCPEIHRYSLDAIRGVQFNGTELNAPGVRDAVDIKGFSTKKCFVLMAGSSNISVLVI